MDPVMGYTLCIKCFNAGSRGARVVHVRVIGRARPARGRIVRNRGVAGAPRSNGKNLGDIPRAAALGRADPIDAAAASCTPAAPYS